MQTHAPRSLRSAAALAALLAAQGSANVPASARPTVAVPTAAASAGDASQGAPRVAYVPLFYADQVAVVGRDVAHRLIGTIQNSISKPIAVAVDRTGNLFVANFAQGTNSFVSEYAPGSKTQKVIYNHGLAYVSAVAVAGDRLYVNSAAGNSIVVFREGNPTPIETIQLPNPVGFGLAVDGSGNIFFTIPPNFKRQDTVYERIARTKQVVDLSYETFLASPRSLAFDRHGNLLVLDAPGKKLSRRAILDVFPPLSSYPTARFVLNAPANGFALDADGEHLWVDEATQLTEYAYPAVTRVATFGSSYCTPSATCVGAALSPPLAPR